MVYKIIVFHKSGKLVSTGTSMKFYRMIIYHPVWNISVKQAGILNSAAPHPCASLSDQHWDENIQKRAQKYCLFSVLTRSLILENRLFVKTDPVFISLSLDTLCVLKKRIYMYFTKETEPAHILFPVYFPQCNIPKTRLNSVLYIQSIKYF